MHAVIHSSHSPQNLVPSCLLKCLYHSSRLFWQGAGADCSIWVAAYDCQHSRHLDIPESHYAAATSRAHPRGRVLARLPPERPATGRVRPAGAGGLGGREHPPILQGHPSDLRWLGHPEVLQRFVMGHQASTGAAEAAGQAGHDHRGASL
jgi:hypothetical protein